MFLFFRFRFLFYFLPSFQLELGEWKSWIVVAMVVCIPQTLVLQDLFSRLRVMESCFRSSSLLLIACVPDVVDILCRLEHLLVYLQEMALISARLRPCRSLKVVDIAKKGQEVVTKIAVTNAEENSRMFGRHFDIEDEFVSRITSGLSIF